MNKVTFKRQQGFTIVELLIVIVVIGILAAITIVAFNGVQNRANDTTVKSDLKNLSKLVENYNVLNGAYPATINSLSDVKVSKGSYGEGYYNGTGYYNLLYCRVTTGSDATYAIVAASKSGTAFQVGPGGVVAEHGYAITTSGVACPRAGVATTLPGYGVSWSYSAGAWQF